MLNPTSDGIYVIITSDAVGRHWGSPRLKSKADMNWIQ